VEKKKELKKEIMKGVVGFGLKNLYFKNREILIKAHILQRFLENGLVTQEIPNKEKNYNDG
jgi:hypothetical protein